MKKNRIKIVLALSVILTIAAASCGLYYGYAASGSTVNLTKFTEEDYPEMAYFPGCSSPFVAKEFVNDRVNTLTGDLEVRQVDIALKGKNGLDFELARYYNSSQANESEIMEVSSDWATAPTYGQKNFDIGIGWEFDLPYVETRGNAKWFHFGSNGTWRIGSMNSSGLKDYTLTDMVFKDNGTNYTLTMKDGKVYKFNSGGKLTSIENCFGDAITFSYGEENTANSKWIKVTDTVGRIIDIKEVADGVHITVTSPNETSKTVSYHLTTQRSMTYKHTSYKKIPHSRMVAPYPVCIR